ncbi:hypothetical protein HBH56_229710 [Parastagonospora nodorum]|uniref:Uncharacterized protein n=2 Tax=Phaeosphaeria nodorum (strain SN15 / ATCC MYA-4574 / FGSC 10173) TaxID=321614 RepID=A0A7U2I7W6_PHANO|nr:hypothetical protein SNOG_16075 [Parastagonospora nodorum SN15]KAH3904825.1 hypothetical protein HBH56_229710 [Parastagonospora nodorum]EAT76654.1 hypothetical protein SNOG_16075 [Parastagonospora nodorum SN15]KAH3921810.1 hypothetical protein HBH54_233040 [Parastagonospora nodorum]KAH3960868.1 hypothetical protein HBH52_234990 [Parastagonospora nodorum]KAH3991799.1 hypothetical protein HBI10_225410 [Parastagonospora nodorum]
MTPNLFLATQKVFQPHKWFRASKTERPVRVTEYWTTPVPGQYEYIPGRGWYLIAKVKDVPLESADSKASGEGSSSPETSSQPREFDKLEKPIPVHRSRVLGRYLLEDDYKRRKRTTQIKNERGRKVEAGFFQLDNGVAWVHCWDEHGTFIPGSTSGYKLWCIDSATNEFRHMRKGDDPNFIRSRPVSREHEPDADARSQESVSTAFRTGPGSVRDGPSAPSTRASSIRGALSPISTPSSRAQSRRNSPKRNNSVPLEEAKAALRLMAKEHQDAVAAAAAARTRTISSDTVPRVERGRPMTRVAN